MRGAWAVGLLLLLGACDPGPARTRDAAAPTDADVPAGPVVEVETEAVRRSSLGQRISVPGSVVARRESRIGVEVKGRIEQIFVDEGDRVEAGDPLFRIDPTLYEMAVGQAEAGLDLARAERRQLQADLARARALRGREVVSEQKLDQLETRLAVSRARERQADRALALARSNLDRTLVKAPYAGSVAQRLEDEGTTALVQPQTIVLVLQETTALEARVHIPESQLAAVAEGDRALLGIEGLDEPLEARVSAVSDSIDPATRTYLVTMEVPNPSHRLKAGVFARVEILPREAQDVLVMPREAVRRQDGRSFALVVRDGVAVAVPVQIGRVSDELVEVRAGVAEGEAVVVGEGARRLAPGMTVRATPRTPPVASVPTGTGRAPLSPGAAGDPAPGPAQLP